MLFGSVFVSFIQIVDAFSSDSKVWMTDSARMSQRQTGQAGGVKYPLLIFERHMGQETNSVRNFRMA